MGFYFLAFYFFLTSHISTSQKTRSRSLVRQTALSPYQSYTALPCTALHCTLRAALHCDGLCTIHLSVLFLCLRQAQCARVVSTHELTRFDNTISDKRYTYKKLCCSATTKVQKQQQGGRTTRSIVD